MRTVPLIGYSDRLSARPGEKIEFKISSKSELDYTVNLYRSINADPNPNIGGLVEKNCSQFFKPIELPSREQGFFPGSYAKTVKPLKIKANNTVGLSCIIFPTLLVKQEQCLISVAELSITITEKGTCKFSSKWGEVELPDRLSERNWYKVEGIISLSGKIVIKCEKLGTSKCLFKSSTDCPAICPINSISTLTVAAEVKNNVAKGHFNGKIEAPAISADSSLLAKWDLSRGMKTTWIPGENCPQLELINFPTRAVKSSMWDGSEMNWNHKHEHYAAVHFHEDDIYDFGWETDFIFEIPKNMDSGIYLMRIKCEDNEDAIPFFVCPPIGERKAELCVLVSTFTYSIYGNHARPDYSSSWQGRIKDWGAYPYNPAEYKGYGLSTYNYHSDGSGICHASSKRPLFNLRPGYITFGNSKCSGLRHFPADSHLISWLHEKEISYDIITDNELHNEGLDVIKDYPMVTTGTHPEYHTAETLDALISYRNSGGSLNYLGGNGFYWKIARQHQDPDILEIRRAEDGIRAWASEPGEYYQSFDGKYGGLWRRNGRPPQQLVGVGFTAQGTFIGMPYKRSSNKNEMNWIFDGIEENIIGDFGFSGNGAAGFELDRVDTMLDEGHDIQIIAQSYDTGKEFMLVPEEQLTHLTNMSGDLEDDVRRADMIYFEVEGGGNVFSTGSITFCGSLPWKNYKNNISRLLTNVFSKRLGPIKY